MEIMKIVVSVALLLITTCLAAENATVSKKIKKISVVESFTFRDIRCDIIIMQLTKINNTPIMYYYLLVLFYDTLCSLIDILHILCYYYLVMLDMRPLLHPHQSVLWYV